MTEGLNEYIKSDDNHDNQNLSEDQNIQYDMSYNSIMDQQTFFRFLEVLLGNFTIKNLKLKNCNLTSFNI
jgi:hypothetical protein